MSLLAYPGTTLIRHRRAAIAIAPESGIFATETWEGRSLGSNVSGTNTTTGGIGWYDNFHTLVGENPEDAADRVLEFPFEAGYENPVTEIWFDMNQNQADLWLRWRVFIPANYEIIDRNPDSLLQLGGNEKEIVIFSDGYSNAYPTLILGRYFQRRNGDGGSLITPPTQCFIYGSIRYIDPAGDQQFFILPNALATTMEPVIDIATDLGKWQTRVLHVSMPTGPTTNDGACELWIEKDGVTYKIIDTTNGPWYGANTGSTGGNYWNGGYFFGSSGSGFNEPTSFYVGDVEWSTTDEGWV